MVQVKNPPTGADVLVSTLTTYGVEKIFAITGAGNLAIIDAIARERSIKVIYSHHEQSAVMEAQGYARVTGKLGVAIVTTGGGTSNVTTGILSAHLDSIPILLISGNESSFHCANPFHLRAYGVQGFDSTATLKPITKYATRIQSSDEISNVTTEAIRIATEERMGPVHIDFPMDLQRASANTQTELSEVNSKRNSMNYGKLRELAGDIQSASAPLFYFGNGVRDPESQTLIASLLDKLKIPYLVSWSAIDLFQESDALNVGRVGIYGDRHANILVQKSDLIIAIGTRLAIPQVGYDKRDFARKAKKWVIEIDPNECAKFEDFDWNIINNDAKIILEQLVSEELTAPSIDIWRRMCHEIKSKFPRMKQLGPQPSNIESQIHSGEVLNFLNSILNDDAIVITDVGAALLNGHYLYEQSGKRRFFTSQGLGEMGFGLPAAIGAHFAEPTKQIVCLNTDGAIMFNLQELQVVSEHKIPLKLFIFNNFGYSMIRISQENLFEGRLEGSTVSSGISFPSFKDVANTFKFEHLLINNPNQLSYLHAALNSPEPVLIEVIMDPEQRYFPRLATNKLPDGTLVSPPIEDMEPKIDIDLLESLLGYEAHENSYKSRGLK